MAPRPTLVFSRRDLAAGSDRRVADNLATGLIRDRASSLDRPSRQLDEEELKTTLVELGGRVDAVAHLHRLLAASPTDAAVDLGEYLRDISAAIVAALSGDRAGPLRFACAPRCIVPPERALAIGFIVVELVTNAVKYAHPTGVTGEISIECAREPDGAITVEVSDDGVGLPEGMDPMTADTLGLRVVRSLAAQLGARVRFEHDALGLSCVLRIPEEARA